MIKACLFDLDGVITDTAKYHYIAWKTLADELGFDFTPVDNEQLKGVSRKESLEILLNIGNILKSEEEKEKLAEYKNSLYRTYILKMTPEELLPGAKEFLLECRKNKIKTALGSASKNAQTIIERLKISDLFDAVIDGTHTLKAKPNPEVFLKGAEALSVKPEECIVFEDAVSGVDAAKAAGMKVIGIGSPSILNKADFTIDSLEEISLKQIL
ncbi:beta-phosphoglucomutase [Marinilabiliaceae bacterium ANBcel2]|nr:beta-phosphoglucomutase [Marinilabiliaceae bacterium ANBcel2]